MLPTAEPQLLDEATAESVVNMVRQLLKGARRARQPVRVSAQTQLYRLPVPDMPVKGADEGEAVVRTGEGAELHISIGPPLERSTE